MAQFDSLCARHKEDQRRLDYRTALICTYLAEPHRNRKKRSKPFIPEDFMPKPRMSVKSEQIARRMEKINTILRGRTA